MMTLAPHQRNCWALWPRSLRNSKVSNRLKGKSRCQVGVFCQLPLSRHFCCRPHTDCRPAKVLTTVTSQANDFTPCHGINVSLSGPLPSCLANPEGSLVAGMSAEPRDLQVMMIIIYNVVITEWRYRKTAVWTLYTIRVTNASMMLILGWHRLARNTWKTRVIGWFCDTIVSVPMNSAIDE